MVLLGSLGPSWPLLVSLGGTLGLLDIILGGFSAQRCLIVAMLESFFMTFSGAGCAYYF